MNKKKILFIGCHVKFKGCSNNLTCIKCNWFLHDLCSNILPDSKGWIKGIVVAIGYCIDVQINKNDIISVDPSMIRKYGKWEPYEDICNDIIGLI